MVPLSDVIFPPHGTEGGKGKGERKEGCIYKYIYISVRQEYNRAGL